ncbi:MAG: hypothetical protein H0W16_02900, partial [Actinobacteria bacterium]|nr:hypothetical protein [Actinomycetota bacterium]
AVTGRVAGLHGIGSGIASRLQELVATGRIAELEELERRVQPELVAFGRLLGVGANRMIAVTSSLGVRTVDEFRAAAAADAIEQFDASGDRSRPPHDGQRS